MFPFDFDCLYADITKIGASGLPGNGDIACLFGNYSRKPSATKTIQRNGSRFVLPDPRQPVQSKLS